MKWIASLNVLVAVLVTSILIVGLANSVCIRDIKSELVIIGGCSWPVRKCASITAPSALESEGLTFPVINPLLESSSLYKLES